MNYIGSKYRLSNFIKTTVYDIVGTDLSNKVFCDIFAGTGIVGRIFKNEVKQVISNDYEFYSYVLNRNYIGNHKPIKNADKYLASLNNLKPLKGFIYQHYCKGGHGDRLYFSDTNGQKIDAIRAEINRLKSTKKIDDNTYYFLLASLLESADKVANTASVYGAYLKQLKKTALKELILIPARFDFTNQKNTVYNTNSNILIKDIKGDILYLDPPYNARQYGSNYHLLNTIAKYDVFIPKGKTGLREYNKSKYCSKPNVKNEFENLIKNADFKYIFLSYNNEGLMSVEEVKNIMEKYGDYSLASTEYSRFKADKDENRNHKANKTEEYLHILVKNL
ncbi:MAG: DNA adenine methylase [Flavobacteriaceae bacterium]